MLDLENIAILAIFPILLEQPGIRWARVKAAIKELKLDRLN